jgi:hypothetical protein
MRWSGVQVPQGPQNKIHIFMESMSLKKRVLEKIVKLKFEKQTQEIKKQIQKLQQSLSDFTNGSNE